ncbi:hypothetical protein DPMN_066538 [Dreissena polymorpha]|uniref:Uncharacterized protein n=1 Tax=Dreissena polymorpha TaxID=45954 RepID=A0A9D3YXJ9_DREPO|nr:hypothetical protein DPMN_066538 [Dreissena polymorpha]
MDSETLSNTPIQKQCQDIIDKISKPSLFSWKECLNMIEYGVSWDFASLKTVRICKPKETVAINTAIAPGFTAYEKPANEPVCVYEWISRVYEGTDCMKFIVRLAAARFAMENFNKYITMLCEAFNKSNNPSSDAKIFFKLHGIDYQNSNDLKNGVKIALAVLVRDTVYEGKGNGPLFLDFLCGAFNYQLTKHFEKNRFRGQDVGTIPALTATLTSIPPSDREVHLLWMESRNDTPES